MRWGAHRAEFVRPAHWLLMLYGKEIVDAEVFGLRANRCTWGHRFHYNQPISLDQPSEYLSKLKGTGFVLADMDARRALIRQQVDTAAGEVGGRAVIDRDLLDEVTALVEWPVALLGNFEKRFLNVPAEALIASMKEHQKYFHLVDSRDRLLPHFITVANIESSDPQQVIDGNERVIRPRLADARFSSIAIKPAPWKVCASASNPSFSKRSWAPSTKKPSGSPPCRWPSPGSLMPTWTWRVGPVNCVSPIWSPTW